jgi:hypothetical protein
MAALGNLSKGKASGPDKIFTDLLLRANENLATVIHQLFRCSYESGEVPSEWKEAEVRLLRKTGKASYHQTGSYRPISLTRCLGKCLERIISTWFYAFVEHINIIDKEQEGFRMFHSTTQAPLRFTQSVAYALAAFVDMEKAYDSVWRNGLLVKLHRHGIQGKIWQWIGNFLKDRTAFASLEGWEGDPFVTTVGLPQGSVVYPLLFNLYIQDIFTDVSGGKLKFEDDGSIWRTGNGIDNLESVQTWAQRWRMNINAEQFRDVPIPEEDSTA